MPSRYRQFNRDKRLEVLTKFAKKKVDLMDKFKDAVTRKDLAESKHYLDEIRICEIEERFTVISMIDDDIKDDIKLN